MQNLSVFFELFHGLTLFMAMLLIAYSVAPRFTWIPPRMRQVGIGLFFGLAAVMGMIDSIELAPGILFDERNVIVALAGVFAGPFSGLVAAIMIVLYRLSLGGIGMTAGIGATVTTCALGIGIYYFLRQKRYAVNPAFYTLIGLLVAMIHLAWSLALPSQHLLPTLEKVAVPALMTFPAGTFLVGLLVVIYRRHHKTTLALEGERAMLNNLINAVPDYIFVKDPAGAFILSNAAYAQAVDTTPEAMIGKRAQDFFPPEMAARYNDDDQLVLSGESMVGEERQTLDADGNLIWVMTTKVPMRNRAGEITGIIGISRDIMHRKQMEQQLHESEQHNRALVENMTEGLLLHAGDGRIITCNQNAEQILGLTRAEMMGLTSIDPRWRAVHEDGSPFPGHVHPAVIALQTGQPQRNVVMGVHKPDGSQVWILVNAQPVFGDDSGRPTRVVATFMDITERKQAENQSLELAAHQQRMRALRQFVTSVSHDLRTPLTVINNSVYLLGRIDDPEQRKKRLSLIEDQVQRISRILDTFSQLIVLADDHVPLQPVEIDLNPIIEEVISQYRQRAASKEQELVFIPFKEGCTVMGEADKLWHVVTHLVENALNYTPPQGKVTVSTTVEDGQAVIMVRDTGIGISDQDRPRIFQELYRANDSRPLDSGGAGMGLAIVQQYVQAHNGSVSVDSVQGSGSAFRVALPCKTTVDPIPL
jgi:PAS domain S-box-containing protein